MQGNTAVFFNKLASGKLWLQYCESCHKYIFYPRVFCPNCLKPDLQWKETSGQGKVYSFTIIHYSNLPEKSEQVPYAYAIVELAEGIRLAANITDCHPKDISIGMSVELTVKKYHYSYLHYFRPATMNRKC
ncbi:MAG: Zn-ribbon domain-containing OB-fold protein [Syntrophomonadaceae bacterium]|jgi:uncharacterized OB-fold protein|nr:Zn-ribbon domain-containing OB-fold protein [Syntrophomonadaceae bacterium]